MGTTWRVWSISSPSRLTLGKHTGWVGPTVVLNVLEKENPLDHTGTRNPILQPVAYSLYQLRYTGFLCLSTIIFIPLFVTRTNLVFGICLCHRQHNLMYE